MRIPLSLAVLLMGAMVSACRSGDETVRNAEDEVFAIHDDVMPQLDDLLQLRKQLSQHIASLDSLKATGSAATSIRTTEEKNQAARLLQNLTVADSLMMNWMARYNNDTLSRISTDDALHYLAAQKDQITDVKTKVNTSIEQAQQFLEKQ
ncbi:viral A-type inclusion protein [Spirosoma sp. KUDC1026]|uniref:viral A-type inclusion protein n=1 Tax=Spirosoma sp. KUDC1026 TaxID=2745947 RepID=UPI00159BD5E1|nr:viral A-type inclusion protein [Spirosoma sp. KUDC1026]QKZ14355.1 viral A-type inclusion protein [Spirosoma sp. KUDC1026]